MATILVVGDEHWSARLYQAALSEAGFNIVSIGMHQAQNAVQRYRPALIVILLSGCKANNLDVCRALFDASDAPIVAIGLSQDVECRLVAFEAGVDDYLTPPFNPRELVARVQAILRRTRPAFDLDTLNSFQPMGHPEEPVCHSFLPGFARWLARWNSDRNSR